MTDQTPEYEVPRHEYQTVAGTQPTPYAEHEPRTVGHRTVRVDNTDLAIMTEIGDGTFVQWTTCRKCGHQVSSCTCPGGPVEPEHMADWRAKRFVKELNERPAPEFPLLESVLEWARERGYVVTKADVKDTLFAELFKAVAACEAPEGTQVDDVLEQFQVAYCEVTGTPVPQWCWECKEDGHRELATLADDNGPLCEGCFGRRVEDGLIVVTANPDDGPDEERVYEVNEDDLDFARDTLGPDATEDEVANLAEQRADRDMGEFDAGF